MLARVVLAPRMAGGLPHPTARLPLQSAWRPAAESCCQPYKLPNTNHNQHQPSPTQPNTLHAAAGEASREAARLIREAKTPMEAKKLAGQPQKLGVQGKQLEGYGAIGWFSGAC